MVYIGEVVPNAKSTDLFIGLKSIDFVSFQQLQGLSEAIKQGH